MAVLACTICFFNSVETFSSAMTHMQAAQHKKTSAAAMPTTCACTETTCTERGRKHCQHHLRWKSSVSASSLCAALPLAVWVCATAKEREQSLTRFAHRSQPYPTAVDVHVPQLTLLYGLDTNSSTTRLQAPC
jgi:hypothetical protein